MTTPVTTTSPSFPRFSELATELQLKILRYVVPNQRVITARTHSQVYGPGLLKLCLSGKLVRNLVEDIYYSENTFRVQRLRYAANGPSVFQLPNTAIGHRIRKLELLVRIDRMMFRLPVHLYYIEDKLGNPDRPADIFTIIRLDRDYAYGKEDFITAYDFKTNTVRDDIPPLTVDEYKQLHARFPKRFSLQGPRYLSAKFYEDHRAHFTHRLTQWQEHFQALEELKIVVDTTHIFSEERPKFEETFQNATTLLRAKNVKVEIRTKYCDDSAYCQNGCAPFLKALFVEMMGRSESGRVE